jgi:hypothetical protein
MPEILARTDKSRVYHKGSRYLVSQVRNGHLCRAVVDEAHAMTLIQAPDYYWDALIDDVLTAARREGSADYFEVKL